VTGLDREISIGQGRPATASIACHLSGAKTEV
jgi:hypothetical protein